MPNIEIHIPFANGQQDWGFKVYRDQGYNLRKIIVEKIQEIGLGKEAITTLIDSISESCDGTRSVLPYIRVCSTGLKEIEKIVKALKEAKVGVDVEILLLDRFIPSDQMK